MATKENGTAPLALEDVAARLQKLGDITADMYGRTQSIERWQLEVVGWIAKAAALINDMNEWRSDAIKDIAMLQRKTWMEADPAEPQAVPKPPVSLNMYQVDRDR